MPRDPADEVCLCIVGCLPEQGMHDAACTCRLHLAERCRSSYERVLSRMSPEDQRKWLEGDWAYPPEDPGSAD